MARDSGIFGNIILLGVIAVVALIFINYLRSSGSQGQKGNGTAIGSSGGSPQSGSGQVKIGSAVFGAWTSLVKAFTQGQDLLAGTPTSLPNSGAFLHTLPLAIPNMNDFTQPFDIGASMGSLGSLGVNLSTSDPTSGALLQTQSLQSWDPTTFALS